MKKQKFLIVIVLVLSLSVTAMAFGPLGPPTAGLKTGQFSIAGEYSYTDSDVKIKGSGLDVTIEGVTSNMFLGQIGYGMSDDWEIYGLVGTADHQSDDLEPLDFDYDFAYGFGTKLTLAKQENLSWGAMFEMGWRQGSDSASGGGISADVDLDYYEMFIALGPTWNASEGMRIYGGPFFYMLDGSIDGTASYEGSTYSGSFDLEEESSFGGYVGAEFDLCPNSSLYVEYQFTGDMQTFGTGISWKF
jgi:hypothetical protein